MFKFSKLFFLLIFLWVPFLNHAQDCSIDNILVEQSDCVDGFFNVFLHVQATNHGGEGFSVLGNGHDYGDFSYEPNFITIGPLEGNGTTSYEFVVIDNQFGECSNFVEIGTVDCAPPQCNIYDVVLDFQSCTSEGTIGAYNYLLNFNYTNTGFDGFDVFLGEQFLGTYAYENLPVHLVSFGPLNTDFFTLTICDNALTDCCASVEVPTPVCPPLDCGFQEVTFNFEGCHDNGGYNYILNFTPVNTTNTHFDFYLNNEFYGYYSYADLPIFLENIGPFNDNHFNIRICDNDNADCCWDHNVETPNCPVSDNCVIENVAVQAGECNADGLFYVFLSVQGANLGTQGFSVHGNGHEYGNFSYEPEFVTIGPLQGNGTTVYEFIVTDLEFPDCQNYGLVGPIDCFPNDCGFQEVTFNFEGCHDNGGYNYILNFTPVNTTNTHFDFYLNNEFYGYYSYADLPIFLENIGPFNDNHFNIRICDNDNPDCCWDHNVETPNCGGGDCAINHVIVEAHDCNEDGFFFVDLEVVAPNHGNEGFHVNGNGNNYGNFSYELPFITLGPFAGNGETVYEFVVTDNQFPDCQNYDIIGPIDCSPEGCGFHDITMNFEGCNDNGSYNFALNFIPVNTINNYYQLFINNEFQGSYAYDNLTQFIEGVGPFEGENFHVRICDNDHPDCCTDFLVETPACNPGGCNFWDVVVEPHITDCNNDIFSVDVAFHTTNNGPLGYYIFANGDIFGPFSYALPFVTIGPFEGDGSTEYDFLILDIGNPACYTYYEFGTFECDEDVWPGDTNTDNIANHFDLLNIGIAFGSEGPQRPEATTDWNAMSAYNWTHFFEDNNNYKHADTNGDGVVNNADIAAIQQNYNLTHGEVENFTPLEGTDIDPPVYMDVPENLTTGNPFEIPVMLGTEGEPVNDIYGIAFSIELDPEIINVADLTVSFPVSWMGEPEVNTITFSRLNLETNSIDIAISRTDQNNVSGHGPIVILHGIIDDIAGIHGEMDLRATGINAIDLSQSPIPLNNPYKTSVITKLRDEDAGFISLMRDTWIHPNPASDLITIMNKQYIAVESVAVYDMSGVQFGTIQYNTNQISVSELPAGLYALKINMGGHVIMKKMVKVQR